MRTARSLLLCTARKSMARRNNAIVLIGSTCTVRVEKCVGILQNIFDKI